VEGNPILRTDPTGHCRNSDPACVEQQDQLSQSQNTSAAAVAAALAKALGSVGLVNYQIDQQEQSGASGLDLIAASRGYLNPKRPPAIGGCWAGSHGQCAVGDPYTAASGAEAAYEANITFQMGTLHQNEVYAAGTALMLAGGIVDDTPRSGAGQESGLKGGGSSSSDDSIVGGWRGTNMSAPESFAYHFDTHGAGLTEADYDSAAQSWASKPQGPGTAVQLADGSWGNRYRTPGGGLGGILDAVGNIITFWQS
jgi:hypothetical protein